MNQITFPKQKIIFVLTLFALFFTGIVKVQAQSTSGIYLTWDIGVGCEGYSNDRKDIFLEEIMPNDCINVCRGSSVTYTLHELPPGATTLWTVSGGIQFNDTNNSVTVTWAGPGDAEISFAITTANGIITKDLCIDIIQGPLASFTSFPFGVNETIKACSNQLIYFTDTSQTNGGTDIVNYYWDFGDGTTTDAQNPNHSFEHPGSYTVSLTVTNSCNCSNLYKIEVFIEDKGFDISCASVVCENQVATYSLPEEAINLCGQFIWKVEGGTIVGPDNDKTVNVRWDQVDENGFGYVTFIPDYCDLPCRLPTTIRVPVIQMHGTINGSTSLCLGEQGRYKLPEWPTTDFQWQIEGNVGGQLGTIIQTNQRNEIIFTPSQAGTITLIATYNNTLIHCGGIAKIIINVKRPMPFNGDTVVCLGSSSTYATTSNTPVTWTLRNSYGTIVGTANNSSTFSHLFTTAGNFTLTVSGNGICDGQTKNIVVTPALLAPAFNAPVAIICPNAPYTYSVANPVANSEYEWQIVNGTIIGSATGPEVNVSFLGSGQIRVRRVQLSPAGCSSPFAVQNVTALTINAAISNTTSVVSVINACSNNYFTYNAINTTGGIYNDPASTFEWSISPSTAGSITSGQGTATVEVLWNNVASPPNFNLVLVIKKCTVVKTINKAVKVSPLPSINITSNATVCSGIPLEFTLNSSVPLDANTVIMWNFGNGDTDSTTLPVNSISHSFNNGSGANIGYTVTATIINANNCVGTLTASKNFVVTPGPNALASNSTIVNSFCLPSQINAILTASTSNNADVVWYKAGSSNSVGIGTSLTVIPAMGFGTYYFIATLNGCKTTSNNLYIMQDCGPLPPCTISPAPNVTFTAVNACGKLTLTGTASGSPISVLFTIVRPGISLVKVPGNNGTHQYVVDQANAGVYSLFYSVTYLDVNGAPCTISKPLTVSVEYIPDFKMDATCSSNGNVYSYNVQLTDTSNFLGTVTPSSRQFMYEIATNINGPYTVLAPWSTNQNFSFVRPPGTYHIRQSIQGSIAGDPKPICSKIQPLTLANMNDMSMVVTQPLCFDTAVKFNVFGTLPGDTFHWTFETVANVLVTNTNPEPSRVFDTSIAGGGVNVTVTVTNKYGCAKIMTKLVNIPARCLSGTIASTPANATACKGSAVQLSYSPGTLPAECTTSLSYVWLKDNLPIANATSSTYLAYTPGFYTVTVLNNFGCRYTSPNVISPIFTPLPSLTLNGPTTLCEGDTASFSISSNATVIEWTINGVVNTAFANQESISIANLPLGTHTVSVKVTANGCDKVATQTFGIIPAPSSVVIYPPVLQDCETYTIELNAYASGTGTYNWSNGANGSSIIVTEGGAYQVTFTNAGGCSTSYQIVVPKSPKAYM
ncbi:MAG: PKD domain-containing protein, partial [Candidatus Saccharimonadaceae bacterium]